MVESLIGFGNLSASLLTIKFGHQLCSFAIQVLMLPQEFHKLGMNVIYAIKGVDDLELLIYPKKYKP